MLLSILVTNMVNGYEQEKFCRQKILLLIKSALVSVLMLRLEQSTLVIGSLTWQKSKETTEPKNMTQIDPPLSYSGAIYKTRLDKNIELEPINVSSVIEGFGELSLDGNILAQMRYGRKGVLETSLIEWFRNKGKVISEINRLEVFRLDNNATPHLIKKRSNIDRALVQNSLLTTVQEIDSGRKICIE